MIAWPRNCEGLPYNLAPLFINLKTVIYYSRHKEEIFRNWFYRHFVHEVNSTMQRKEFPSKLRCCLTVLLYIHNICIMFILTVQLSFFNTIHELMYHTHLKPSVLQDLPSSSAVHTKRQCKTLKEFWKDFNIYVSVLNMGHTWHEVKKQQ
jgi:hypothetical protein